MNRCPHCGVEISDGASEAFAESGSSVNLVTNDPFSKLAKCPQCGHPQNLDFLQEYLLTVRRVLISPTQFFSTLAASGGLTQPLTFALVTHWVGSSMGFLWGLITGEGMTEKLLKKFFLSNPFAHTDALNSSSYLPSKGAQDLFFNGYFGLGSVLLDPFITLVSILTSAVIIFIGARILVSPARAGKFNEIRYESAVRIISYGLAPSLLITIPFLGKGIASIYTVIVTIIGIKEMYRISSMRATMIALFPKLFIFVIMGLGLMTVAFAFFKFFSFFSFF